jgi:DUF2075 family protein/predicted GIY-YIG superfamily endonuclease
MASLDFEIVNYDFDSTVFGKIQDHPIAEQLWPIVYIIHDDRTSEAYIGETTDVISRMSAHLKNDKKKKLTTVNLISSEKFNKSATLDIESNLIKYMAGDGKYSLINGNLGIAYHTYYQKADVYWPLFTSIWDGLRSRGIAKQSIEAIDNSDLFKYSPYKSLRFDQVKSLKQMLVSLADAKHQTIVMEGGAGTGKTILAVFLFKLLVSDASDFDFRTFGDEELEFVRLVEGIKAKYPDLKMGLVVPMTSFRTTLKKVFSNVKGLKSSMVISPADVTKQEFDILLVDESHRLRQRKSTGAYIGSFDQASRRIGLVPSETNELEWILKQSDKAVFFYDAQQSIKPSDVPQVYFDELKKQKSTIVKQLTSQFRVMGGVDYVEYIGKLLNVSLRPEDQFISRAYDFKAFDSLDEMVQEIKLKNDKVGLSRLIAGFSWDWVSNKPGQSKKMDISIDGTNLKWNGVTEDWINSKNSENEVGCIHTTQGYDLNYAGIIFGNEIGYDPVQEIIFINKDNYRDKTGKQAQNDEELKRYIINIYKTMMLRGIKGTFLYACEPGLRAYLKSQVNKEHVLSAKFVDTEPNEDTLLIPFKNSVPLYSLKAAAGTFSETQQVEFQEWIRVPENVRVNEDYFACIVNGESMNRVIENGAIALFKKYKGGTREGQIVLVELQNYLDSEFGSCYTVKEYHSVKSAIEDEWTHESIVLRPLSYLEEFDEITLNNSEGIDFKVVGVFDRVIDIKEGQIQLLKKNNGEYPWKEAFYKESMIFLSENLKSS